MYSLIMKRQEQVSRPPACKWMRADEAALINDGEAIGEDTSHYRRKDIGVAKWVKVIITVGLFNKLS